MLELYDYERRYYYKTKRLFLAVSITALVGVIIPRMVAKFFRPKYSPTIATTDYESLVYSPLTGKGRGFKSGIITAEIKHSPARPMKASQ